MALNIQAEYVLKVGFLIALLFLLGYLVYKLMILDDVLNIITNTNNAIT
jgi:hypothetical protein